MTPHELHPIAVKAAEKIHPQHSVADFESEMRLTPQNEQYHRHFHYEANVYRDRVASIIHQHIERLVGALEWYAANHRPEDYLNDNGDKAKAALNPPKT